MAVLQKNISELDFGKFWKKVCLFTITTVFFTFFIVFLCSSKAAEAEKESTWPKHLRILSGQPCSQLHVFGNRLASLLSESVIPSTARAGVGHGNIGSVSEGKGDIAFTFLSLLKEPGFDSEFKQYEYAHDNISLLAKVHPHVLYIVLQKDFAERHGIDSFEKLLSTPAVRFATIQPGSAVEYILTLLLDEGYGKSFENLRQSGWSVAYHSLAGLTDNFSTGKLDSFAYLGGMNVELIKKLEEHTEIVFLPIELAALERMSKKFNTNIQSIEPGNYKCVSKPIVSLGDDACLIVRKDLPDELVSQIAMLLWEQKSILSSDSIDFKDFSPEQAVVEGYDMHPGALVVWDKLK